MNKQFCDKCKKECDDNGGAVTFELESFIILNIKFKIRDGVHAWDVDLCKPCKARALKQYIKEYSRK